MNTLINNPILLSGRREKRRKSAFRAVNSRTDQNVTANTPVFPVLYPNQIFDLRDEYKPNRSTFIPKMGGIYLIIASVAFFPDNVTTNYRVVINIRVNGIPVVTDNGFLGANPVPTGDQVSVSAILKLAAGDKVSISVFSTTDGVILAEPRGTHFEAVRV